MYVIMTVTLSLSLARSPLFIRKRRIGGGGVRENRVTKGGGRGQGQRQTRAHDPQPRVVRIG